MNSPTPAVRSDVSFAVHIHVTEEPQDATFCNYTYQPHGNKRIWTRVGSNKMCNMSPSPLFDDNPENINHHICQKWQTEQTAS